MDNIKDIHDFIIGKIIHERINRFGITEALVYPEKEFSEMTTTELREYVTFFCELPYCHSGKYCNISDLLPSTARAEIREKLNAEFNRRAGQNFVELYDHFDRLDNKEKWGGEIRYQLLSFTFKGYSEFSIVRKVSKIIEYCTTNDVDIQVAIGLIKLLRKNFYWNIDNENLDNNRIRQDELIAHIINPNIEIDQLMTTEHRNMLEEGNK